MTKKNNSLKRLSKKQLRCIVRDYEAVFSDCDLRESAWENTAIEFSRYFVREKFFNEKNRLEKINKSKNRW